MTTDEKQPSRADLRRLKVRVKSPTVELVEVCIIYPARGDYAHWPADQERPRYIAHSLETDMVSFGQTPLEAYESLLGALIEFVKEMQANANVTYRPAPEAVRARYSNASRVPLEWHKLAIDRALTLAGLASCGWQPLEPPVGDVDVDAESLCDQTGADLRSDDTGVYYDLIHLRTRVAVDCSGGTVHAGT